MKDDANGIALAHGTEGVLRAFDIGACTVVNGQPPAPRSQVEIISGAAVEPVAVNWIWPDWLAQGKLHLLAGAPGTSKTTIALNLAAAITAGGCWPDGTDVARGSVLVWSGEDGVTDTLLPRFLAAGGDRGRIHFVGQVGEGGQSRPFEPATDMQKLVAAAQGLPALRLVILDPVVAAVQGDSHKNTETRRGLQPIVDLAAGLDCAVLGITHFSKGTGGRDPVERVAGSIAFGAVARVVWATVKPADPDAPRRLVRAKSNLGPDTGGFEYRLFGAPVPGTAFNAQRVEWGAALEGSAKDLMTIEQPDASAGAAEDAAAFLLDILSKGPVPTKDIDAAARAHGHAPRTVRRAKGSLGIKAMKSGMKGGWCWELPAAAKATATEREGGRFD